MKIKHKISLMAVLMCLLCIATLWMINRFLSAKYMINTLQDKVIAEVKVKVYEINTWIEKEKYNLEVVAERIILAKDYESDTLFGILSQTADMNFGNLYYMAFEDGTLIEVTEWEPDESFNTLTREWYVKAKENNGQVYICDPYVDAITNKMVLTLSKEITLKDGRKAVLGVDMQISDLNRLLNAEYMGEVDTISSATSLGNASYENTLSKKDGSYAFIIDRQGNVISHPNPDFEAKPDHMVKAADILGGRLNEIRQVEDLALEQRMVKDYDGKVRAFFFDLLDEAGWTIGIAVDKDTILEAQNNFIKIALSLSAVLLCSAIAISILISGSIAKPIKKAKEIANNISELNLHIDIDEKYLKRNDEAGEIARAIKETINKLRSFAANLNDLSVMNNKIYNNTLEKANQLLSLSEGVSATTQELSAGMEETSATAVTISQSVDDLNNAVSVFADKTEEGAKTANQIAKKAAELDKQFKDSKDNTMNILNTAKDEVESALESARNVEQVKLLADAILDIASKTNLLALNAAIEAARAGENGKGFAVVAEQIRSLSDDSNKSAGRIKQFAEDINVSVNKLILATNHLLKFLDENVLNDYGLMLNAIENYKNDGSMLNNIMSELSKTAKELYATIYVVSSSINDVSATIEQATAATANIAEQNSEMVGVIEDINKTMQMNTESASKLADMIAQVKL